MTGKQFFLVRLPSGIMARKQCSWFGHFPLSWLRNNVCWVAHLCETWSRNNVSWFAHLQETWLKASFHSGKLSVDWNGQENFSLCCELWVGTNDFNTKRNFLAWNGMDNFPEWTVALRNDVYWFSTFRLRCTKFLWIDIFNVSLLKCWPWHGISPNVKLWWPRRLRLSEQLVVWGGGPAISFSTVWFPTEN